MRSQTVYKRTSNVCCALSVLLLVATLAQVVRAQNASPTLIPFQGRLTDQAGVAYANGQYTLTFNLYDQAVGGSTVWTERHEKVGVINGTVNVFLGSIQSIENVAFDTTKYLGITVDADDNPATADPEMVPRTMIIPAFYAKNAGSLAGHNWTHILTGGSNNPQTGFINGGKIGSGTVTNVQIQDGGVTTADLGNGQVTAAKLAAGAADSAISDGAITSAKILNGGVATVDLADGAVTSAKIADGAVANTKIQDESISPIKLYRDIAVFEDSKAQHTNGGSAVAGWQVRTLNSETFLLPGGSSISRAGNTITLQPGVYYIQGSVPAVVVSGSHQAALLDVTGNPVNKVFSLIGTSEASFASTSAPPAYACSRSRIEGFVTVSGGARQFQIWQYCHATNNDSWALGRALVSPTTEPPPNSIFTRIVIERVK